RRFLPSRSSSSAPHADRSGDGDPFQARPSMQRSTKICVTLVPASSSADVLTRMLAAGVDVMRLNFSHGPAADHEERARMVREAARSVGHEVANIAEPVLT